MGDVRADGSKVAVGHFQYLRAGVSTWTQGTPSAESSNKHAATCYSSSILSNSNFCKDQCVIRETLRKNICSEIARLLKEERQRRKLSLNALAAQAGLNRQTVSFIEQEQRTPTIDTLLRLTDVLEIELSDVLVNAKRAANRRLSGVKPKGI
ncbi:MAG: helix-turn-helix transcriptional regulator [Negativicutes bacterium]|nr:helix-turn-helix transcriptional regulator [Negativicutes bacterium]